MSPFQETKLAIVGTIHLAKDALHIYVALILFFGSAALMRWPLKSWRPWLVVLAFALLGEAWDLRDSLVYHTPISLWGNWKDVWNALLAPTAIMLLARHTRVLRR